MKGVRLRQPSERFTDKHTSASGYWLIQQISQYMRRGIMSHAHSAISIAQIPEPQPTSSIRNAVEPGDVSFDRVSGAVCNLPLRARTYIR